jgi:DHA3 family tetracycline resistance protein-like MFS transporter
VWTSVFPGRWPAFRVWLVYSGAWAFIGSLSWTTAAVYLIREVGMSPLELILAGTAMELAYFLFEVPTGIVADLYSRRLSLVIAAALIGAASLVVGMVPHTTVILAASALWGFGWTFRSGSEDAWLADEIGPERLGSAYQRGAQVSRLSGLAGIVAAVALALVDLRLPLIAAGTCTLGLALLLIRVMPEEGFRPLPRNEAHGSLQSIARTAREGREVVWGHPVLFLVLGIVFALGMWGEGFDRLNEAHLLLEVGLPSIGGLDNLTWFGILDAGTMVLSFAVAAPFVARMETMDRQRLVRLLIWLYAALIAAALAFAFAAALWLAVAAYWATTTARELAGPPYATWLNNTITDSRTRATVLSITSVFGSAGEWAGGPILGWIGSRWSVRSALAVGALTLTPALALLGRAAAHQGREPELAEAGAMDV